MRQVFAPEHAAEPDHPEPWVRLLNAKRGLHLVVLYLEVGEWRLPWSFRAWRGKEQASPSQLACKLSATVPSALHQGRTVIVQGDSEFSTVEFLTSVRQRTWRAVTGIGCNRRLVEGRTLQQLYRNQRRGEQVYLEQIPFALTISWSWLKCSDDESCALLLQLILIQVCIWCVWAAGDGQ